MWILLLIALVVVFLVFWWNQKQLQRPRRHWEELFRARRSTTHSSSLERVRHLRHHALWADEMLIGALEKAGSAAPEEAIRELGHIAGTQEVWLARIHRRQPASAVWPMVSVDELRPLFDDIHREYAAFVAGLDEADLHRFVTYTNSAGRSFTSSVVDILDHVFLHSQYHRGKVNLLLRQAGHAPGPCDFIAFVRGAPAAITKH